MIDLMSIAASIASGLAKDLITNLHRTVRKPFEVSEKEKAVDRCLKTATESAIIQLKSFAEKDQKRLADLLQQFFDDSDVIRELSNILIDKPLNMKELADIYMEIAHHDNIAGFDIEAIVRVFAESFRDAAAQEKELVNSLNFGESTKQTKLQEDISKNVEKLANQKENSELQQNESAKARYLKSLARECLILPLSAMTDESTASDKVTLDQVYIDLDTTSTIIFDKNGNRIKSNPINVDPDKDKISFSILKALDAATENKRIVLLGDPGSGKSTFVKILCALLAQGNNPPGFEAETLPVYIQLRDLAPKVAAVKLDSLPESHRNNKLAAVLHAQIREELERLEAEAFTDHLCDAIRDGKCLLVLDGLDEVPFDQRKLIHQTVLAIISKYAPRHIIVTCRIRSYRDDENETDTGNHKLPGFEEFTLAKFDSVKIANFVTSWYTAQKDLKLNKAERQTKIDKLTEAALSNDLIELSSNPMLLTTMAVIHQRDTELPDKRVQLYKLAVDVLARRWRKHHIGDTLVVSEKLSSFLKDDTRLLPALERLAYEAHTTERINRKSGDLERMKARDILEDDQYLGDPLLAIEFLDYVDQKSGLLTGKGGKLSKPVSYGFPHRTFQEYLSGCHIAGQRSAIWKIMKRAAEGNYWATAVQLGFEELYYNRRNENSLLDFAYRLCPKAEADGIAEERQHLWSSNIAKLLGTEKIKADTIDPNGGRAYLDRLRRSLGQLLSGKLPFEERAEAGRNLAKLGNEQELGALKINPVFSLRKAATELSVDQTKAMLKKYDFADTDYNKEGKGCLHVYQLQKDGNVVMDYATGMMWQQSGSSNSMLWKDCQQYIDRLNGEKYAGFSDWRMPTLEEAMSLMEREKKNGDLYVDSIFAAKQRWIWTADRNSASLAWYVFFSVGGCVLNLVGNFVYYARAVRS